uniref:Uncharacterized protein n=1 Tax=Wuchereria bancrofti TaxID=6293 RepID=A0AAF5PIN0_WUCBA
MRNLTSIVGSRQCGSSIMIFWIILLVFGEISLISLLTMDCRPSFDDILCRVSIEQDRLRYHLSSS